MNRIRDDLDPASVVRLADRAEPCVLCGKPTTGRSTVGGREPVHYACLQPPLWYALAKRRGAVAAGGTSWGAQTSFPSR
jgi:hypothetical protein